MNAPIVKWMVSRWGNEPKREEFIRETEHMLYSEKRGRLYRTHKVTDYHHYFDTEADALAAVNARLAREIEAKDAKRIRDAAPCLLSALEYARNLIGPDEIIDAAIAKAKGE